MSEKASLDGPIAKLERAAVHGKTLHEQLIEFWKSDPYELIPEFDPKTNKHLVRVKVAREPDNPEWGLLLGDMVQNLRSALDHLVWQLVILNGRRPKPRNQFPITKVESDYWEPRADGTESIRDRMLWGICEEHRAPIDAVQPYNAGDWVDIIALSQLAWLSNVDKHRVIHVPLTVLEEPGKDAFTVKVDPPESFTDVVVNYGPLKDGAVVVETTVHGVPDTHVDMKANLRANVTLGERGFPAIGITKVFDWIKRYVWSWVPVFEGKPHPGTPKPRK